MIVKRILIALVGTLVLIAFSTPAYATGDYLYTWPIGGYNGQNRDCIASSYGSETSFTGIWLLWNQENGNWVSYGSNSDSDQGYSGAVCQNAPLQGIVVNNVFYQDTNPADYAAEGIVQYCAGVDLEEDVLIWTTTSVVYASYGNLIGNCI